MLGCANTPPTPTQPPEHRVVANSAAAPEGGTSGNQPVSAGGNVPLVTPGKIEFRPDGSVQLPLNPPADIAPIAVAPAGLEGDYVPTIDYLAPLPYGLMIFGQNDQLYWILANTANPMAPEMLGFGTFQRNDVESAIVLTELKRQPDSSTTVVAIENFKAAITLNRLTVGQANHSEGKTAFGKAMDLLGSEVHWVRISACDAQKQAMFTAPLVGGFSPITRRDDGSLDMRVDSTQSLHIWPDGVWRLVTTDGTQPRIVGGTWILVGQDRTAEFTQNFPPALQKRTDTFHYTFDAERGILWLYKTKVDGVSGPIDLQPKLVGADYTTLYVINRRK